MTEEERSAYIMNMHRPGITVEQQIREELPFLAGELGNDYGREGDTRMGRYTHDVRWCLGEIDRLRAISNERSGWWTVAGIALYVGSALIVGCLLVWWIAR